MHVLSQCQGLPEKAWVVEVCPIDSEHSASETKTWCRTSTSASKSKQDLKRRNPRVKVLAT
eukprot:2897288-Amphidinium_carterae.1